MINRRSTLNFTKTYNFETIVARAGRVHAKSEFKTTDASAKLLPNFISQNILDTLLFLFPRCSSLYIVPTFLITSFRRATMLNENNSIYHLGDVVDSSSLLTLIIEDETTTTTTTTRPDSTPHIFTLVSHHGAFPDLPACVRQRLSRALDKALRDIAQEGVDKENDKGGGGTTSAR